MASEAASIVHAVSTGEDADASVGILSVNDAGEVEIEGFGDQASEDVCREIAVTFPDRTLKTKPNRKD